MTADQPADLDRLRRAHTHYAHTGRDHDAHELAAEIPALAAEIERLRAELDTARAVAQSNRDKTRILTAVVDAAYAFADELDGYCSPHGVSGMYAQRLRERLDGVGVTSDGRPANRA